MLTFPKYYRSIFFDVQVVRLVELLDEAMERCISTVKERRPDISEEELQQAARAMGYGAVKYADLKNHRSTNYRFSFDEMLSLQVRLCFHFVCVCVQENSEHLCVPNVLRDEQLGLAILANLRRPSLLCRATLQSICSMHMPGSLQSFASQGRTPKRSQLAVEGYAWNMMQRLHWHCMWLDSQKHWRQCWQN